MKTTTDRRQFLTSVGHISLGIGVLYTAMPAAAATGAPTEFFNFLGEANGERPRPFQLRFNSATRTSDSMARPIPLRHQGIPERAVELINGLPPGPWTSFFFTGDLTHDTEDKDVHAQRMKQFLEISKRMKVGKSEIRPRRSTMRGLDGGASTANSLGEQLPSITPEFTSSRSITCRAPSPKSAPSNSRG